MYNVQQVGATVDSVTACARLVQSLPDSWEPFKQSWGARPDSLKTLQELLIDAITDNVVRRGLFKEQEDIQEATALVARMSVRHKYPSRGRGRGRWRGRGGHYQNTFQRRTFNEQRQVITCYNCGRRGHKRPQCKKPVGQSQRPVASGSHHSGSAVRLSHHS